MTTKLSDLITALEAATGPSRELDERLAREMFGWRRTGEPGTEYFGTPPNHGGVYAIPAYTQVVDAIMGPVKARWPGRFWSVAVEPRRYGSQSTARLWLWDLEDGDLDVVDARHRPDCPALALCLAAVRLAEREAGER